MKLFSYYHTLQTKDGIYGELRGRFGTLDSKFNISDRKTQINTNFKTKVYGVGSEIGKKYGITEKVLFIPQVQLDFTHIEGGEMENNISGKTDISSIKSLIGRTGARVAYKSGKVELFTDLNLNHEFVAQQKLTTKDSTTSSNGYVQRGDYRGTWTSVGVGTKINLTENANLYINYEQSFGDKNKNTSQVNATFRLKF